VFHEVGTKARELKILAIGYLRTWRKFYIASFQQSVLPVCVDGMAFVSIGLFFC